MDKEAPADSMEALVTAIQTELKSIKDRLNEIKSQIDSTQTVISREQQRNSDIATELRTIQDNLDSTPRTDIRSKYDEALDARFRLTTMRGQLEKFQASREYLEKEQTLLSSILSKLNSGVGTLPSPETQPKQNQVSGASVKIERVVQAQEDERQRLARQMHDGPAQSLTNFILQAEICQRLFDRNPDRAAEELDNLKTTASVTFQKVRDFIFDLRPMMLDDLGVMPTIRRYVDSFREKNDIDTKLDIMGEERRLESHREVMIFRGIQELMSHARDYANATKLTVKVDLGSMGVSRIKMSVEDDGRGFDAESVFSGGEEGHVDARAQGLITMKERFELVGGSLRAVSSDTEGTTISLELPSGEDNR